MKSSQYRSWIFSHRNILPVPFLILVLAAIVLTGRRPTSVPLEIAGWILIAAGEALRIASVGYSGATTRSMRLKAERLVTWGPYAWTRNPIYLGNFTLGLGFCCVAGIWWVFPLYLMYFAIQYGAIISLEENFLREKFGRDFDEYTARVPRFLPGLFPRGVSPEKMGAHPVQFQIASLSGEYWTLLGIVSMGVVLEALKYLPSIL